MQDLPIHTYTQSYKSSQIFENITTNGPFVSNSFQSSHYKNYECNHCFFFSSPPFFLLPLFLFLLSFSFTSVILELIGPKDLPFDVFLARYV